MAAHQQHLAAMPSIQVQEKASWIEAITAVIGAEFERANKYNVLDPNGTPVFYAVETTGCCSRQIKSCCPDCAPWDLDIIYLPANQVVYKLTRGWTCTCCCINRPVVTVIDTMTGNSIGSIQDPCACCNLTLALRDPNDDTVISANGGCCQWGLCCPLPCGPCAEVNFPLEDTKSGNPVGHIRKKVPSCLKFIFASDVDNYEVDFGAVQNPDFKALVMALTIFMDFRWFNDNRNDDQGGLMGMMAEE